MIHDNALGVAGCSRVWTDTASGAPTKRPQLAALFDRLRAGDALVVWRLDRLGRSLPLLIETVRDLEARGVRVKSVQESIDTTTPGGRLVFHVFSALAQFELVRERTMAGLAAAWERGRLGGRPTALTPVKLRQAQRTCRPVRDPSWGPWHLPACLLYKKMAGSGSGQWQHEKDGHIAVDGRLDTGLTFPSAHAVDSVPYRTINTAGRLWLAGRFGYSVRWGSSICPPPQGPT